MKLNGAQGFWVKDDNSLLEARLFNQWAGPGEFTPTAILLPLVGRVKVFRLWQLSQNPKHGKNKVSNEVEQSLFAAVKQFGR